LFLEFGEEGAKHQNEMSTNVLKALTRWLKKRTLGKTTREDTVREVGNTGQKNSPRKNKKKEKKKNPKLEMEKRKKGKHASGGLLRKTPIRRKTVIRSAGGRW